MNTPSYFEIQADDLERAVRFYTEVFGWTCTKDEHLPIPYFRIETNGPRGGLLARPVPAHPGGTNAFTCSMQVESFDATAANILSLGGQVAMEKFAIPGTCWQGYFLDTEGNTFGLFQPDPEAK